MLNKYYEIHDNDDFTLGLVILDSDDASEEKAKEKFADTLLRNKNGEFGDTQAEEIYKTLQVYEFETVIV